MFLETCPYILCHLGFFACDYSRYSLIVFVFLWYQLLFPPFHFLFCLIGCSLSSWWAWPEVYQIGLLFQRTHCWFYWLVSIFKNLYITYFISDLYPSFCWLWILFVLLFLILLSSRVKLFENFLFFEEGLYELPSKNCFCYIQ